MTSIMSIVAFSHAEVAKLVDALDSKSSELRFVPVRVRPSAPDKNIYKRSDIYCYLLVNNISRAPHTDIPRFEVFSHEISKYEKEFLS